MSRFIIYTLSDPFTQEVRYVGLSTSGMRRPKRHFHPSRRLTRSDKVLWINSVMEKGKAPIITVIGEWDFISMEDLRLAERYWINYFKANGSPLTNSNDGGTGPSPGVSGHPNSKETIEKLRSFNKGKTLSEETKAKISASLIGNKYGLGHKQTHEHIEKKKKALIGGKRSAETKAKMSAAQKNRFMLKRQAATNVKRSK